MSQTTPSDMTENAARTSSKVNDSTDSTQVENSSPVVSSITQKQADEVISLLKSLKQNIFILTLIAGFFAFRVIVFHR